MGAVLRGHREGQGRSLGEIAGEAGCSPAYLSEVERGRKDVSTELLVAIAYALAVPIATVYIDLGRRLGAWPQAEPAVPVLVCCTRERIPGSAPARLRSRRTVRGNPAGISAS